MEARGKKLIKNTAILSFGTMCTKGIMFLMTPLFTRWLTQSEYGTFDLIITYTALLIPIITLQCGEAVFRLLLDREEENEQRKIITNAIVIDIIGFLIATIIVGIISIIYEPIRYLSIYFLILTILEAINKFMTMVLRGLKKLDVYTISNIIFVISMVISVTVCVKILELGLHGILIGYMIGYIISILYTSIKVRIDKKILLKSFDKDKTKEMLQYSLPLIPNELSWWIVNVSDRTIVSVVLGTSCNAILAVANKIPNLCQTLFNVFHLSWQENASETIDDKDKDIYYTNVMNNMITILTSICIVILSGNFLIFKFLFSAEYFSAYYQVPILILSIIVSMLAQFLGGIYIARKQSNKNGKTTIIAAAANIFVHLLLIKFINIYAATISTLISYLILFIIRYIDIKKSIDIKFNPATIKRLAIFIYFFITAYVNNLYLNIINIILAMIYFAISNKEIINKVIQKFVKNK